MKFKKGLSLFLLVIFLSQIFAPTIAYALTAGPTAPEATNFEPIDTTDIVNPLTGSFTYNMPLVEIPGPEGNYPLSLSYHAGIQPNEEASWVGLGWSLNPGAIARNVNGYPDDWDGADDPTGGNISNYWSGGYQTTYSIGVNVGVAGIASVGAGLAFASDTYRGFGVGGYLSGGIGLGALTGDNSLSLFSIGGTVGINPYGGAYAGAGITSAFGANDLPGVSGSISLGLQTNFQSVSATLNGGISTGSTSLLGATISTAGGVRASLSAGSGETSADVNRNQGAISSTTSSQSISIPVYYGISISLGKRYTRYWSATNDNFSANGVLYSRATRTFGPPGAGVANLDDDNYSLLNSNIASNPDPYLVGGGTFPNFDDYVVTAQGLGGSIRPYTFQAALYNENRTNSSNVSDDVFWEQFPSTVPLRATTSIWQFRFVNDMSNSYRQGHPWSSDQEYNFDTNPVYGNNDGNFGYEPTTNRLEGSSHIEYFTNNEIVHGYATARGFIDCQDVPGFSRRNLADSIPDQIGGFMITNSSGVTYHYALPAYNRNETSYTASADGQSSNTITRNPRYAYTWYLTAITGPDYVNRGTAGSISNSDWGYWVKFIYGKWTDNYAWRNPSTGLNEDVDNQFKTYSSGIKQLYYLDAIQTRTNTAIFEKEIRADGHDETGMNAFSYPSCQFGTPIAASTLKLNNIYLFQNDQLPLSIDNIRNSGTTYNQVITVNNSASTGGIPVLPACSVTTEAVYGQGVIDKYDINPVWANNCLRKIAFNYDYSLSPGVPNSYDATGGNNTYFAQSNVTNNAGGKVAESFLGKLTLLSVDFQGKGGTPVTPPVTFAYDVNPTDPVNQASINITSIGSTAHPNYSGTVQVSTVNNSSTNFQPGDILSFSVSGVTYYCTLLSTNDNYNFNVLFLNNPPPTTVSNLSAVRTKNPPYNYDAYDIWQCYKSDYIADGSNVNIARYTTPVSGQSTDVWSLRSIQSSVGTNIHVNYESNTYSRSVLTPNPSVIVSGNSTNSSITVNGNTTTGNINNDGTLDLLVNNPQNINLSQILFVGSKVTGPMVFLRNQVPINGESGHSIGYQLIDLSSYPKTQISSINGNDIKVQLDPNLLNFLTTAPLRGANNYNSAPTANSYYRINQISFTTGNLIPTGSSNLYDGGGTRVKNVTVDDLNGNVKETVYNYNPIGVPAGQVATSGVTSYIPDVIDPDNLSSAINTGYINTSYADDENLNTNYRAILYNGYSNLMTLARFAPAPGVMYETVGVSEFSILPNSPPVPINGSTIYQYETFKPEMIGVFRYHDVNTTVASGTYSASGSGFKLTQRRLKDVSIKDYTSRVGNLKRVISYDNNGNKLSEKINHYLNDDLDNTALQNQINNYEPRMSNYQGVDYNYLGETLERYATSRVMVDNSVPINSQTDPTQNEYVEFLIMSNKETFPTFLTSTTQIDYKNGNTMTQSNLAYDYYTGAVTKSLSVDSYGNRFIDTITPAYMAGGISAQVYPALGLRTHDDVAGATQHKQMLTQQASNYTFSVNASNTPVGVVTASVQTWSNSIPVLDPNGNLVSDNSESNIWRMNSNYSWMPVTTSANNIQPYSSFVDYFSSTGGNAASWKQTGQITQYNVYSAALEAKDINSNYSASRMGYNNSKVLVSGTSTMYNEVAYAGAEDALLSNGYFSNNISPGAGTIVSDSTKAHTGINSLMVASGQQGFTYSVPISQLSSVGRNYSVAVWVYSPGASVNQTSLYYTINGNTVTPPQSYVKTAKGWCLLEMTIPSTAISGSGNLVVGCTNGSAGTVYFDDFRFQPTSASITAYVYDIATGELTYIIGNNNLFTRYQYDSIGRLVRIYKEVLGKSTTPIIKGISYNYGRGL
jgi:hypothetical protein